MGFSIRPMSNKWFPFEDQTLPGSSFRTVGFADLKKRLPEEVERKPESRDFKG
jgi:hypothetical protein